MRPSAKKSKMMCFNVTRRSSGQTLMCAIQHFESAEWHFWMSITLLCSGAFWTPFLGFLEPGLALRRVF